MASEYDELWPHAFHLNLPSHHIDEDGIPYVSKFAQEKARNIMTLVHSIQLNESLYVHASNDVNEEEEEEEDEEEDSPPPPKSSKKRKALDAVEATINPQVGEVSDGSCPCQKHSVKAGCLPLTFGLVKPID